MGDSVPIKVTLQDIYGKKIKQIVPTGGLLNYVLPMNDPQFPMLRYVDPYGNTIFNGLQMYPILEELDRIVEELDRILGELDPLEIKTSSEEAKEILGQIRELAVSCRDNPHTFLRFIGD